MRLCLACDSDIDPGLVERHPSNQFCADCVEKAFLKIPLPWYRCGECNAPCNDEYGYGDVSFCSRTHKDMWEIRRARTLMTPEELAVMDYRPK